MVTAVSDRVMALAGIISAVSGDAADLLACRDLAEQVGQDWCIADMAPGDLDDSNLRYAQKLVTALIRRRFEVA